MKEIAGLKLFNLKELEAMLGVGVQSLQAYCRKRLLKGQKIKKMWYVEEEELKNFLKGETYPEKQPRRH